MAIQKLICVATMGLLILFAGCSQQEPLTAPEPAATGAEKDGSETLGTPSIAISAGSGFVEGGVGMIDVPSGQIDLEVPAGVAIEQVLLYWAGGTTGAPGDDTIEIDGTSVQGTLIGGPIFFFKVSGVSYEFSAYRADITDLNLVQSGANSLTVSGFDFDTSAGTLDENNGCSVVVITDNNQASDLILKDGLDMAYFGFEPTLDATVPQVFALTPANVDRTGDLLLVAASVGEERPNSIRVTTSLGDQFFDNTLGSNDGLTWDSLVLPVTIPAGDTSVTVQLISTNSQDPHGASLGWVAAGVALAEPVAAMGELGGTVFVDANADGTQGSTEGGIANVVLDITDSQGQTVTVVTDENGDYAFNGPVGSYTVALNPAAHPEGFNGDLEVSFTATTLLVQNVSLPVSGIDFGFVPAVESILNDLEMGELISEGEDLRYWRRVFRRAVREEWACRRAHGHRGHGHHGHHGGRGHFGHNRGWGHGENYPNAVELRALLATIEGLYLPEPYQFSEDRQLIEVFRILKGRTRTDEAALYRELLVTELNFVSGAGLVEEADRLGVLISWGESVVATGDVGKTANKDRASDVFNALRVFSAINTGGGGGVDE